MLLVPIELVFFSSPPAPPNALLVAKLESGAMAPTVRPSSAVSFVFNVLMTSCMAPSHR